MQASLGSVRLRTTLAATVLTAVILTIASLVIVQLVERDLLNAAQATLDSALEDTDGASDGERADEVSGDPEQRLLSDRTIGEVQESVDAVVNALQLIVPGLVLVLGAGTWFMVGRALRPVHAISEQVASITSATLDERVPVPPAQDEIAELAMLMNQMIDRLEAGSKRQRQFVADASHELRSPLSTIKAAAGVAAVSPDPGKLSQLAGQVSAEADRMEELIADLLDLARFDEGDSAGIEERVELSAVCRAAADRLPPTSAELTIAAAEAVTVRGVELQLERAIFNVLTNAAQHAQRSVQVQVRTAEGRAEIVIDDDGPGIAAEDRERIFDRFVRLDGSRSRATGGSGIGLALVEAITTRHGGTITVTDAPELGGARFVLDLGVSQ